MFHVHMSPYEGTGTENDFPLPADAVTVSNLLKGAGYKTAVIGKWGQGGPGSTGEPNKQGFFKDDNSMVKNLVKAGVSATDIGYFRRTEVQAKVTL